MKVTRATLICRAVRESHRILNLLDREPHRYEEFAARGLVFKMRRTPGHAYRQNHSWPNPKIRAVTPQVWDRPLLWSSVEMYYKLHEQLQHDTPQYVTP